MRRALVAAALLASVSCGTLPQALPPLRAEIERVEVIDVSFTDMALAVHVVVPNPLPRPVTVPAYSWRLAVDGLPTLRGDGGTLGTLPARADGHLRIPVAFHIPDLLSGAASVPNLSGVPYTLTVSPVISTRFGDRPLPFVYRGVLDLPRAPAIALVGIRVWRQTWSAATVQLDVKLTPRGGPPLELRNLSGALMLNGRPVLDVRAEQLNVPLRHEVVVPITAHVSLGRSGQVVAAILQRQNVSYRLSGHALLNMAPYGALRLPIDRVGTVALSRPES